MRKSRFIGVATVALGTLTLAGGLVASNMGFKLNRTLIPGGLPVPATVGETAPNSLNGTNGIALPDNRQTGLNDASQLKTDIGATCISVANFLRATNGENTYTGARGQVPVALESGVGYKVRVSGAANTQYIAVGSDDPTFVSNFLATSVGVSLNGSNWYAYNYHQTATTASALKAEIGPSCISVAKFTLSNNGQYTYTGARGQTDITLNPGEVYVIRVSANVPYTPSHY